MRNIGLLSLGITHLSPTNTQEIKYFVMTLFLRGGFYFICVELNPTVKPKISMPPHCFHQLDDSKMIHQDIKGRKPNKNCLLEDLQS